MAEIVEIFDKIYELTHEGGHSEFASFLVNITSKNDSEGEKKHVNFDGLYAFLRKIFKEIDDLATEIKKDNTILISVRNQKLLRTCFQIVTSLGFSLSLLPGVGVSLSKRSISTRVLPKNTLTDEQKYELLVACTDFFTRCYELPVLKSIILTFHMSDYLAALIQLSFAPLKKPGIHKNFTMTQEMYDKLNLDRQKYVHVYEHLVCNCFQPILMKELLVLQSVTDPPPPTFVKKAVAKEMSRRLLASGGLLSLTRCFIESHTLDTGADCQKIETICKIVAVKHGTDSEDIYLQNICSQLSQILSLNSTNYLATAVACVLTLVEAYPQSQKVKLLTNDILSVFDTGYLLQKSNLPGTIIFSPQEVEHKVKILHACCTTTVECPISLLTPNLDILYFLGVKCTKNEDLKNKLSDILLKCLSLMNKNQIHKLLKNVLFGNTASINISVQEFEAGLSIKCVSEKPYHDISESTLYFLELIKTSKEQEIAQKVFEALLLVLRELWALRKEKVENEVLLPEKDEIVCDIDEQYAHIVQLLAEASTLPAVVAALKQKPSIVLDFIEFILNNQTHGDDDCTTIALVLLNTTLIPNSEKEKDLEERLIKLIPVLTKISMSGSWASRDLCKEALSLLSSKNPKKSESLYEKAVSDVLDPLLPVRAHGIIQLTKLIDALDPETISKKHYVFCLLQAQLKDEDSYVYLSAINGVASLGTHCPEEVLLVLCQEFLNDSSNLQGLDAKGDQEKVSEMRMKVGDVIVKVTRRLGEMAVVHKTLLLNTILSGCRDDDPLLRTSALSNLAEIMLVLHYKVGTVIYEILNCVWSVIESDKAIECRRAAVMVLSSLLKGLGPETIQLNKDYILPIYRTLKKLYSDTGEDSIVKLHAQIALEELDETVKNFLFPELILEKQIFVLDNPEEKFK